MGEVKSRYTLPEAAEYLKRETGTPDVSVHDIVTLAAEGKLSVCFHYKGPLGLFKDMQVVKPTHPEIAQTIFGQALKTVYFNGILRSLSRPAPDIEITDLRGHTRKAHTLHPVRVAPICVFASVPAVELGEPEGHHWRRVHGSNGSRADTQLMSDIPEAEWMVEAASLHRLADASTQEARPTEKQNQPGSVTSNSPTDSKLSETNRRIISTKTRRDTLTPVIEQAQQQCSNPWDTAEVWAVLSAMAEKRVPPLLGAIEDGIQWRKDGDVEIFSRKSLAERIRRTKPR